MRRSPFTLTREQWVAALPAPVATVRARETDAVVYLYREKGRPCAIAFSGKRNAPDWRYAFLSDANRAARVTTHFENVKGRADSKAAARAQRSKTPEDVKVGSIFAYSWGYDQTNVEFYEVVSLSPSGKSATLREIGGERVEGSEGFDSCSLRPRPGAFLDEKAPIKKRLQMTGQGEARITFAHGIGMLTTPTETHYCSWYA